VRKRSYLAVDSPDIVPTGTDPASDEAPALARAVALERLALNAAGDRLYTCTSPWSAGTTGSTLSPLELLEKLAARGEKRAFRLLIRKACRRFAKSWSISSRPTMTNSRH